MLQWYYDYEYRENVVEMAIHRFYGCSVEYGLSNLEMLWKEKLIWNVNS